MLENPEKNSARESKNHGKLLNIKKLENVKKKYWKSRGNLLDRKSGNGLKVLNWMSL